MTYAAAYLLTALLAAVLMKCSGPRDAVMAEALCWPLCLMVMAWAAGEDAVRWLGERCPVRTAGPLK